MCHNAGKCQNGKTNEAEEELPEVVVSEDQGQVLGWREWVSLPELGIPAIKAKLDTGARTSALHTYFLETLEEDGKRKVRFGIHPLQRRDDVALTCVADIIDERVVTDSGGHAELRLVIQTMLCLGDRGFPIEVTLTNRENMRFRMLLGRTAMTDGLCVNPSRSYQLGKKLKYAYQNGARTREKK